MLLMKNCHMIHQLNLELVQTYKSKNFILNNKQNISNKFNLIRPITFFS